MTMIRGLFFLGATFFTLVVISGAPARYDQRQDGDFNLHAQLKNFLFVVAIPSNNDLLSDLALQALEFKQQLGSRASSLSSSSKDHGSTSPTAYKSNEAVHGEEPYSIEIIRIDDNRSHREDVLRNAEEKNTETSNTSDQQHVASTNDRQDEKVEDTARTARSAKDFELAKSREVPTILAYFVDARKTIGSKMEDGGRAQNVVGNVWNSDLESGRPGTSLKKQLFQRRDAEHDAPSSNANEKEATFSEKKQQELRLLGDGIENCGPGRRRDASGVCQFDESAASLL